jgi:hypothetical protein
MPDMDTSSIKAEEMPVAAEESAPLLRYPLHRQGDYGATIEFVVQRIKAEYDEEDAILKAPSIGYSVTPRDKPTAPAAPAAPLSGKDST